MHMSFLVIEHAVYSFGASGWWGGIAIFAAYAAIVFGAARTWKGEELRIFERWWGYALAALLLVKHLYLYQSGLWNVHDNLEMHLCGFSRILSILLLAFGARWAFYPLFFWGIVGGFHSLLTPELTSGDTPFMYAEYYIVHGGIIIIPLYFVFARGWMIGKWTWAKVLGINILLMAPVGLINYLVDANYMFLCQRPMVDNPFIMGDWPFYIFGFLAAGVLHYGVLTLLFWKRINKAA